MKPSELPHHARKNLFFNTYYSSSIAAMTSRATLDLLDLPDDVLLLIVELVTELEDMVNLYESCRRLGSLISRRNVRSLRLGRSPLAIPETLQIPFFRNFAVHITDLDLKLVQNLTKSDLIPALKRMKNLKVLDISYTDMNLNALPDICKACPKLHQIGANIHPRDARADDVLIKCLQKMEYINLVDHGNMNSTFTDYLACYDDFTDILNFKTLKKTELTRTKTKMSVSACSLPELGEGFKFFRTFPQDFAESWEFISFAGLSVPCPCIYMSPNLYERYKQSQLFSYPDVEKWLYNHDSCTYKLLRDCATFAWHKHLVERNEGFYEKVLTELDNILINITCNNGGHIFHSSAYYIGPCCFKDVLFEQEENPPLKRKRVSNCTKVMLNISEHTKTSHLDEKKITLQPNCSCNIPLRNQYAWPIASTLLLDDNCEALQNITFLHLYLISSIDKSFFKTIFTACKKLTTLNMKNGTQTRCVLDLCKNINRSKSLKDLKISEPGACSHTLFASLTLCTTLENVHLTDLSATFQKMSNATLIQIAKNCVRLHSFQIIARFSECLAITKMQEKLVKKTAEGVKNRAIFVRFQNIEGDSQNNVSASQLGNAKAFASIFYNETVYRYLSVKHLKYSKEMCDKG